MGAKARHAARELALAPSEVKDQALRAMAQALRDDEGSILAANAKDVALAQQNGTSGAFIDRLTLDPGRVEAMAAGLEAIAALPDPTGEEIARWRRPNGLDIARIRVPLGVIGIIYESRPNVTADAGALCLKSGNAAILRGGSESFHSSRAIADSLATGLKEAGLPEAAIQLVPTRDREAVGALLRAQGLVDIIVPRGGKSLITRVQEESRVPVLAHLDGICHVYVHSGADPEKATSIALNAKMRRTGICGAAETVLVDRAAAPSVLPGLLDALIEAGCEVRGEADTQALDSRVRSAVEEDWDTEYLDAILAIRQVDGVEQALDHIERHGSHHTDCIVTEDQDAADRFLTTVDSAIVLHNASTQFADGGEFGMGAEIGISTGRLHARGPVGADKLTTYKYVVRGTGQVRP
ncbi:MAG: glutamate-5-semialdehyde dehydrogenase [Pseudomonadota bacterium]